MRAASLANKLRSKRNLKSEIIRYFYKLFGKKPAHLIHINKTGGTAIKNTLRQQLNTGNFLIRLHSHNVTLKDIPKGDYVFFVIRDPISKFISGFYSRKRQGQPHYHYPWSKEEEISFSLFSTPNELALALASDNKETQQQAKLAMSNIAHIEDFYWDWFTDKAYLESRKDDILFIADIKHLSSDFVLLRKKLGLPDSINLVSDNISAHKTPVTEDKHLDEQAIENLRDWYRSDYEFMDFIHQSIMTPSNSSIGNRE